MKKIALIFLLLLCLPVAFAKDMTLLAVQETPNGLIGGHATLTLEVQEGQGRVFLETAPLTKIDTQVSTRFAQQVACNYLSADCSRYDFIYTIRSNSPIVGGPSAGAAMAILTISQVEGVPIDDSVAITGTINSGGIIGPVGGVKQKVEAASKNKISTVLIPLGEGVMQEDNQTLDVIAYGASLGVEVIEVDVIDAAIPYFFGKELREESLTELVIDSQYQQIMGEVANELCTRSMALSEQVSLNSTTELLIKARLALDEQNYYSAASRCFNANIQFTTRLNEDLAGEELLSATNNLQEEIANFKIELGKRELDTMPKLQTYMLVGERLSEADVLASQTKLSLLNNSQDAIELYAFAKERYASAVAWSRFFEKSGEPLDISERQLLQGCQIKLEEADERMQYISTFYPGPIDGLRETIAKAKQQLADGDVEFCLNTASLAKARADTLISGQGLSSDESVTRLVETKLKVAQKRIVEEQSRGVFPIAGYAYYEYAKSLEEENPGSALLYAQYALELSSFDLYFSPIESNQRNPSSNNGGYELLLMYAVGLLCGAAITYVFMQFQD